MSKKGILGLKKDPKKQVLFWFNAKEGDEMSDNSDDSDYNPMDDSDQTDRKDTKRKQRIPTRPKCTKIKYNKEIGCKSGEKKLRKISKVEACNIDFSKESPMFKKPASVSCCIMGTRIPPEVLLIIFQHVVDLQGALPFLTRASRVCKLWYDVSSHPNLWMHMDLSFGWMKINDRVLQWLAVNRLSKIQSLTLHHNANAESVKIIASFEGLKVLKLSHCKKLKSDSIILLADKCPHVQDIDLTNCGPDAVSSKSLQYMLEKWDLIRINFSGNKLRGFQAVFNLLMHQCPNLEYFNASRCIFTSDYMSLSIEEFQSLCPKLTAFHIEDAAFKALPSNQITKDKSKGFPHLKYLSLPHYNDRTCPGIINDDFIMRFLRSTIRLKLLDLHGKQNISFSVLKDLPSYHIENLDLGQSHPNEKRDISPIILKWRHSLHHLNLSWNLFDGNQLDKALGLFNVQSCEFPLRSIDLRGTTVSIKGVRNVIKGCKLLEEIDLTSCRSLPRGIKSIHRGRPNVLKLL